mmetsp:Transcript_39662/g.98046  ORF Transcript_39662/g.98046 Transcript_39662/m.98046 type:complete len:212 (+) Transcript_39662:130-765(+)
MHLPRPVLAHKLVASSPETSFPKRHPMREGSITATAITRGSSSMSACPSASPHERTISCVWLGPNTREYVMASTPSTAKMANMMLHAAQNLASAVRMPSFAKRSVNAALNLARTLRQPCAPRSSRSKASCTWRSNHMTNSPNEMRPSPDLSSFSASRRSPPREKRNPRSRVNVRSSVVEMDPDWSASYLVNFARRASTVSSSSRCAMVSSA